MKVSVFRVEVFDLEAEIEAESRRLKYKGEYESLADFVLEISSRTDIDKVRIGQLIHEKANKLRLHPG